MSRDSEIHDNSLTNSTNDRHVQQLIETTDDATCRKLEMAAAPITVENVINREERKMDRRYEKYFTPLLTASSVDYLEALYEQTQYELYYLEAYTATGQKELPQQLTATMTEQSVTRVVILRILVRRAVN